MNTRAAITNRFAARDPGRARLTAALSTALGVVLSAATASVVLHALNADSSLLVMAVFLSMMTGLTVKGPTAISRFVTTAVLIPTVVLAICIATLLSSNRPVVIGVFVVVVGAAIWLRRFGPRAAAMGSLSFMGFFFTLVMKSTVAELPAFCLVAAIAVGAQLVVRALLLLKHPRREITLLLREFRIASSTALHSAQHAEHAPKRRAELARIDEVARAITIWQQSFRTDRVVACDELTLDALVLNARVSTEEACLALARFTHAHPEVSRAPLTHALAQLTVALDAHATPAQRDEAANWAQQVLTEARAGGSPALWEEQCARALLAHLKLRAVELSHGLAQPDVAPATAVRPAPQTDPAPPADPVPQQAAASQSAPHRRFTWLRWGEWSPTSRMAVQAMIAALIATGVGEAISATRWYWAVITVFVVFVGGTTRSGILTKAFRRVLGTVIGVALGIVVIMLAGHITPVLVAVCVLAVFGMLYFGPLNYTYTPVFITVMLMSLYRMMGILDQQVMELRIVETLAGALIGVLCAYLILSSNSRPALVSQVNAYFDSLDDLLRTITKANGRSHDGVAVAAGLHRIETSQAEVDKAVAAASTALLIGSLRHDTEAVHLMYIATRAAATLTQAAAGCAAAGTTSTASTTAATGTSRVISQAISTVLASSDAARQTLCVPKSSRTLTADDQSQHPNVLAGLNQLPAEAPTQAADAIRALARMNWALHQISDRDTNTQ